MAFCWPSVPQSGGSDDPYSGAFGFEEAQPGNPRQAPAAAPPPQQAPPPPPLQQQQQQAPPQQQQQQQPGDAALDYVHSRRLAQLSAQLPVNQDRSQLVHSLVEACGLLQGAEVAEAAPATPQQLQQYHSPQYVAALAHYARLPEAQRATFGLQDDCTPFPGMYEYAALCAGGSLQAAAALCSGAQRLAVHLDGGRHHAHKSRAAGFCYVNDAVLAILQLLSTFQRVMYVDVDIHHCDAVEEAFELTDHVLTLSLHKHAPAFFPGSGALGAGGQGRGAGFALNLPLGDGLRDGLFEEAFRALAGGAFELYRPDCVVLQCGVDGLAHDPVAASWGLTPRAYASAAAEAARWGVPLLVLGGGGYDSAAAACAWAAVLAALQGRQLADDIPEHEHFERYGPSFSLYSGGKPLLAPDQNNPGEVQAQCARLLGELQRAVEARQPPAQGGSSKRHCGASAHLHATAAAGCS